MCKCARSASFYSLIRNTLSNNNNSQGMGWDVGDVRANSQENYRLHRHTDHPFPIFVLFSPLFLVGGAHDADSEGVEAK